MKPIKISSDRPELWDRYIKDCKDGNRTLEDIKRQWSTDMRFAKIPGRQWSDEEKSQRKNGLQERPTLEVNTVGASNSQIINPIRSAPPTPHVIPISPMAKDIVNSTANALEGLLRYADRSGGKTAFIHAFDNAVNAGYGVVLLRADYESPNSLYKILRFQKILDPTCVSWDMSAREPDMRDMTWAKVDEVITKQEFKEKYPTIPEDYWDDIKNEKGDDNNEAWGEEENPKVINYIYKKSKPEMLYQLDELDEDGVNTFAWESELDDGDKDKKISQEDGKPIGAIRDKTKVMWCKMAGGYLLEEIEWPCENIPVYIVIARDVEIEGKRQFISATRALRDAQKLKNYAISSMAERAMLAPKPHWVADAESLSKEQQRNYETSSSHTKILFYNSRPAAGDSIQERLSAPQYVAPTDFDQGLFTLTQFAGEAIKEISSNYNPVQGQNESNQSGVAIQNLTNNAHTANADYLEHMIDAKTRACNDFLYLIPEFYSEARQVQIVGQDDKIVTIYINKTYNPPNTASPVAHDFTARKYKCIIEMGKPYETATQQNADAITAQMNNPLTAQAVPDIAWDAIGRAIGMDPEMRIQGRDRIKKLLPPALQDQNQQQQAQMAQQAMMLQHQIPLLQQELQKLTEENKTLKSKHDIEFANAETKRFEALIRLTDVLATHKNSVDLAHLSAIAGHEGKIADMAMQHSSQLNDGISEDKDRQHSMDLLKEQGAQAQQAQQAQAGQAGQGEMGPGEAAGIRQGGLMKRGQNQAKMAQASENEALGEASNPAQGEAGKA